MQFYSQGIFTKSNIIQIQKMDGNKRLKIAKRQKDSLIDFNYQKQMSIEEAFQLEKNKNHSLKEKNDRLQIKCKLLYEKLYNQNYEPQQVFGSINEDIYQLDKTIKKIEEQIYFRYSKQMQKLKKKVFNFLGMINFEIQEQDFDQINDQINLILFLLEVFQLRYDQLTNQNQQTQELIQRLREPQQISGTAERIKQLEEQIQFYIRQNNQLKDLCQNHQKHSYNYPTFAMSSEGSQSNENVKRYLAQINNLESQKAILNLQIQNRNQKISSLQFQIESLNKNARIFQEQFNRNKKQEIRWKQRYNSMQRQKNQRIRLLQTQLNRRIGLPDPDESSLGFSN